MSLKKICSSCPHLLLTGHCPIFLQTIKTCNSTLFSPQEARLLPAATAADWEMLCLCSALQPSQPVQVLCPNIVAIIFAVYCFLK